MGHPELLRFNVGALVAEGQSGAAALSAQFFVVSAHDAAAFAPSVADGAARPAAFEVRGRFVLRVAGALFPAGVQVSAGPSLLARTAFPAASGICGPV